MSGIALMLNKCQGIKVYGRTEILAPYIRKLYTKLRIKVSLRSEPLYSGEKNTR
jgi:hypothetical protein